MRREVVEEKPTEGPVRLSGELGKEKNGMSNIERRKESGK